MVEYVTATCFTVLLSPLFVIIAIAVLVESGRPVFFVQPRFGRGARAFPILKFRTMHQELCDISGAAQTADSDQRITRVGQILRQSSLDELPQLVNVLLGQMALIGPRAHPCGMRINGAPCEEISAQYHERHAIRPGITGWAQVNGSRGAIKSAEMLHRRVSLDLEYIENRSLMMDLKIMLRTIIVVLKRDQAQ